MVLMVVMVLMTRRLPCRVRAGAPLSLTTTLTLPSTLHHLPSLPPPSSVRSPTLITSLALRQVALPQLWPSWDLDGDGFVTEAEFVAAGALLDFLRAYVLPNMSIDSPTRTCGHTPTRASHPARTTSPSRQHEGESSPGRDGSSAVYPPAERGYPPSQARQQSGRSSRQGAHDPEEGTELQPPTTSAGRAARTAHQSTALPPAVPLPPAAPLARQASLPSEVAASAPPEGRAMPEEVDRV